MLTKHVFLQSQPGRVLHRLVVEGEVPEVLPAEVKLLYLLNFRCYLEYIFSTSYKNNVLLDYSTTTSHIDYLLFFFIIYIF